MGFWIKPKCDLIVDHESWLGLGQLYQNGEFLQGSDLFRTIQINEQFAVNWGLHSVERHWGRFSARSSMAVSCFVPGHWSRLDQAAKQPSTHLGGKDTKRKALGAHQDKRSRNTWATDMTWLYCYHLYFYTQTTCGCINPRKAPSGYWTKKTAEFAFDLEFHCGGLLMLGGRPHHWLRSLIKSNKFVCSEHIP